MFKSTQQADPCLELLTTGSLKPHKASSRAAVGGGGVPSPSTSQGLPIPSLRTDSSVCVPSWPPTCPLCFSRSLSEEESPFPPTSILFLLACIFLSKLLAASALWAAAWHGQKQRPPQASGPDCGHNPGYQLQTLTGELGEHSGGRGWRGGAERR